MSVIINGTTGISGVDGTVSQPAVQGNDADTGVFYPSAGNIAISTNGTEALRVDSSQNVGIGTTSPTSKLDINGAIRAAGDGSSVAMYTGSGQAIRQTGASGGAWYLDVATGGATNGEFIWRSSNAYNERMRIDASGNLLVGTSSANYSGLISATKSVTGTIFGFYTPGTGGTSGYILRGGDDSTQTINIFTNGNVQNKNNSYGQISDISLKENVVDATSKLEDLLQVKIRNFNFIADAEKKKQIGVIAQEIEQIFPSLIDVDGEGIKSVKYSVLVPILIKAFQELSAKNDALEARIAALEAN